jgi:hypothetical protein
MPDTCPCREALDDLLNLLVTNRAFLDDEELQKAAFAGREALAAPCGCEEALQRAVYLAEHLWQMIPPEVWREHGAEYQGQYEGDYYAEKVREELALLRERSADPFDSQRCRASKGEDCGQPGCCERS